MTTEVAGLIPHAGAMCLLSRVAHWSEDAITCLATSHLSPANPLRSRGRLAPICGVEYVLQAAAVHGALLGGTPQPPGYLASVRLASLHPSRLDDPALGTLTASAQREGGDVAALLYALRLEAEDGRCLLEGRATIVLPRP